MTLSGKQNAATAFASGSSVSAFGKLYPVSGVSGSFSLPAQCSTSAHAIQRDDHRAMQRTLRIQRGILRGERSARVRQ